MAKPGGNKTANNGSVAVAADASSSSGGGGSNGHGNGALATNDTGTRRPNGVANGSHAPAANGAAKSVESRNSASDNAAAQLSTPVGSDSTALPLFLRLLRTVVIDAPPAILFAALVTIICTRRIYDNYLSKNLESMVWTKQRKVAEITYYDRRCDPSDISTRNVADLLIQSNYTKDDCVHHMMVHGVSMYPDLLSADTTIKLRQFVLRRNAELTDKDAIGVIENKQRWSFGIGANEDPSVAKALKEIATHSQLAPALEGIAGHDPAVIEMTAITSAYGGEKKTIWLWL